MGRLGYYAGPRTWRCLNCRAVYCDLVDGTPRPHVCPMVRDERGRLLLDPARRNEHITQDGRGGPVRIIAVGMGRELLAEEDLVTAATIDELNTLRIRAGIGPKPAPEDAWRPDPRQGFPAPGE